MRPLWPLIAALAMIAAACTSGSGSRSAPTSTTTAPTIGTPTAKTTTATGSRTTPSPTTAPSAPTTVAAAAAPCRGIAPPAHVDHVVWIVMENRGLTDIVGSPSAPYLDGLAASCGLATDYAGVAHPSLPNYIALTSGSTQGITDDNGPGSHPLSVANIFSLLGNRWRSLDESMPDACDTSSGGEYATKHNPAVYYTNVAAACAAQDVPMNDSVPDVSAAFTLITPNLCDDMHDCSTAAGDSWLSREVPLILAGPQYRSGDTALFITWDENDSGGTLVPTYVIAPSVIPSTKSAHPFNHYSLLRTTEDLLGAHPLFGNAASASDMAAAFHL